MTDPIRSQVRELYASLRTARSNHELSADVAALKIAASPEDVEGAAAVQSLRRAIDSLDDVFQPLVRAGEKKKAKDVKAVMDGIAAVLISINRAVVAFLDGAADVAAATQRVREARKNLEDEASRLTEDITTLDDVSAALDVLTQIVEL